MPMQEATAITNQRRIVEQLEAAKRAGVISEYLLRWRGGAAGFKPKVTVWRTASIARDFVLRQLAGLLAGVVASTQIVVLDDEIEASKPWRRAVARPTSRLLARPID
jgi:hypothetical protein